MLIALWGSALPPAKHALGRQLHLELGLQLGTLVLIHSAYLIWGAWSELAYGYSCLFTLESSAYSWPKASYCQ